ncbi:MAG: D-tagatose-bisphosphate aldolase, class II, non-catalytic subunit [Geminicoccaceae bacterium]
MRHPLFTIPERFHNGTPIGITSVCSAHPIVIEAALRLAKDNGRQVLIEATCNQVNQDGGYTGMTPADFRQFVDDLATNVGIDPDQIIYGGDHLGPNPWKHLPADEAMAKAEAMIAAFAKAGFTKLHLDTSMGCRDEPVALADQLTAERAARLASAAEAHKQSNLPPVYIIGTEVPVPGGALEELDHVEITSPAAVAETYWVHKEAFERGGLEDAFSRVIGLVVQPGVEFGHSDVIHFKPEKARDLSASLRSMPGIIFEAHSTDYQTDDALRDLIRSGFCILKVGPWLTFALREALYALDGLADVLECHAPRGTLMTKMEEVMMDQPDNWKKYYAGDEMELWLQRHFSYSDRIRYHWPAEKAQAAVSELRSRLEGKKLTEPLLSQFLPKIADVGTDIDMDQMLIAAVQNILRTYDQATAS